MAQPAGVTIVAGSAWFDSASIGNFSAEFYFLTANTYTLPTCI